MSLKERVLEDTKKHMKLGDKAKVKILRFIHSGIKNKEIEVRPRALQESDVISVFKKQIKQVRESLESFEKAGYKERVEEEKLNLLILESYLPKSLSEEEVKKLVEEVASEIKASSLKDMKQVMKLCLERSGGAVDGKMLSQIVKDKLS